MPNTLAAAGYHIGWSHKWHLRESLMGGKQNQYSAHGGRINEFSEMVTKAEDKDATKQAILKDVRGNFQDFLDRKKSGQPFFTLSTPPTRIVRGFVARARLCGISIPTS